MILLPHSRKYSKRCVSALPSVGLLRRRGSLQCARVSSAERLKLPSGHKDHTKRR